MVNTLIIHCALESFSFVCLTESTLFSESRTWGHEAKLRPDGDSEAGLFLIADPTQTALSGGVVLAWQVFAKIISIQHAVYLQAGLTTLITTLAYVCGPSDIRMFSYSLITVPPFNS